MSSYENFRCDFHPSKTLGDTKVEEIPAWGSSTLSLHDHGSGRVYLLRWQVR